MEVSYQRDMNHNYMILECEGSLDEESYETRMIFANKIPGLLPCHIRYVDGRTYLGYDVTSRQNLTVFCESRKIGKKEIRAILGSILETISVMEEYLLSPDHLIADPKFVLMNFETQEAVLAFAPFYRKDIRTSLRELTEYLLTFTAHNDQQGIVLGYRFSHELTETNSGVAELLGVLYEKNTGEGQSRTGLPGNRSPDEGGELPGDYDILREGAGYGMAESERARITGRSEERRTGMPGDGGDEAAENRDDFVGETYDGSCAGKSAKSRSAVKRALLIVGVGLLAAAAVYAGLHYLLPAASVHRDIVLRVGAAILICAAAMAAGVYFRRKSSRREKHRDEVDLPAPEPEGFRTDFKDIDEDMYPAIRDAGELQKAEESHEDTLSPGANVTTLLTGGPEGGIAAAVLMPEDPGTSLPTIPLSDREILIGKQKGLVSCVLDSPAVSRIHARIRRGEDGYYLRDLNSTNGTSVNGEPVFGNEEVCLREGDRIVMADVVYVMK